MGLTTFRNSAVKEYFEPLSLHKEVFRQRSRLGGVQVDEFHLETMFCDVTLDWRVVVPSFSHIASVYAASDVGFSSPCVFAYLKQNPDTILLTLSPSPFSLPSLPLPLLSSLSSSPSPPSSHLLSTFSSFSPVATSLLSFLRSIFATTRDSRNPHARKGTWRKQGLNPRGSMRMQQEALRRCK